VPPPQLLFLARPPLSRTHITHSLLRAYHHHDDDDDDNRQHLDGSPVSIPSIAQTHTRSLSEQHRTLSFRPIMLRPNAQRLWRRPLALLLRPPPPQTLPLPPPTTTTTRTFSAAAAVPLTTNRPRLVVVGTGWGAASLLRHINPKLYDLTVISERNHMVFTPLLSSVTVGTLRPASVAVHVSEIQPALKSRQHPNNAFLTATALNVLPDRKVVECRSADGLRFYVEYDRLVLAAGSQGSTFGIPGVEQHALPLRDVRHAEAIRARLIRSVQMAGVPGRSQEDSARLLSLVIVGGGPTGVEVAGEISNFVRRDLARVYPDRSRRFSITLVEARELLGTFDASLREYAAARLTRRGVQLRRGVVRRVTENGVELADGAVLPASTVVWSTGVGPTAFTLALPFAKTPIGRLAVDGALRVLQEPALVGGEGGGGGAATPTPAPPLIREGDVPKPPAGATSILAVSDEAAQPRPSRLLPVPGVYALGDCCADVNSPLPPLAQVAEQQGRFLARRLNEELQGRAEPTSSSSSSHGGHGNDVFQYRHLGSMATTGGLTAVLEVGAGGKASASASSSSLDQWLPLTLRFRGFFSWVAWRSAYLTKIGSASKRMSVAFDWLQTMMFGRDLSQW
jgi:NADH:ubiquinone reductase (non-electrogenic)